MSNLQESKVMYLIHTRAEFKQIISYQLKTLPANQQRKKNIKKLMRLKQKCIFKKRPKHPS